MVENIPATDWTQILQRLDSAVSSSLAALRNLSARLDNTTVVAVSFSEYARQIGQV
jgi:hypothetical protein